MFGVDLRAHKARFALNTAPLLIGGSCLIVLASLMASAERLIGGEVSGAGAAVLTVRPGAAPPAQQRRTRRELEQADAVAMAGAPALTGGSVSAERETQVEVGIGGHRRGVRLTGADPRIAAVHGLALAGGRFFTEIEVAAGARVAVVGAALGKRIAVSSSGPRPVLRIGARLFTVVGVLLPRASFSAEGPWAWDERVIVPHTTFRASFQAPDRGLGANAISRITWRSDDTTGGNLATRLSRARRVVSDLITARHLGVENFRIQEPGTARQQQLIVWIGGALLLSTALVSFLVGGFTITNAALASVASRRREIGIRRAFGASRKAIARQFLIEASLRAAVGGIGSAALGGLLSGLATRTLSARLPGWQLVIPPWSLALALLLALVIGTLAGVYPAWRAARLDPIPALRPE